jgi:tetratricopeptide (TPR) repeat protein
MAAYREAIRLQPAERSYVTRTEGDVHKDLGIALQAAGDRAGAMAEFREAIRLNPNRADAHFELARALLAAGDRSGGIAEMRWAMRLGPGAPEDHFALGNALADQGSLEDSLPAYREAVHLNPDDATFHYAYGSTLYKMGNLDGAIAEYHEAIRLGRNHVLAHCNLAVALKEKGACETAMAEVQETLRLEPELPRALATRAELLLLQGRFGAALADLERARDRFAALGDRDNEQASAALIAPAHWLVEHGAELAALVADGPRKRGDVTCLELAALARGAGRPALAAWLYGVAFKVSPGLASDPDTGQRLAAARAAVAAAESGAEPLPFDDMARPELRRQALVWLKADLAAWSKRLDAADARSRATIARTLDEWKRTADLAGVREARALEAFSEGERWAWQLLWAQVESLAKKAGTDTP